MLTDPLVFPAIILSCSIFTIDTIMLHFAVLVLAACGSALAAKNPACSSGVYSKLASYSTIKPVCNTDP